MPKKPVDPPSRPTVFISYSHKDEGWKDRLVSHLKVLEIEEELEVWDDRRIEKGSAWQVEIAAAMSRATVALLLISKDFLTSGFIRDTEVPRLLQRRSKDGLRVIPLFVHPCAWAAVKWIADLQGGPRDAKALSGFSVHDADQILADLALEIQGWLNDGVKGLVPKAPNGGEGRKPGVSTPGGQAPQTTPKARSSTPAGVGASMPVSLRDSGDRGGRFPGVEPEGRPEPPQLLRLIPSVAEEYEQINILPFGPNSAVLMGRLSVTIENHSSQLTTVRRLWLQVSDPTTGDEIKPLQDAGPQPIEVLLPRNTGDRKIEIPPGKLVEDTLDYQDYYPRTILRWAREGRAPQMVTLHASALGLGTTHCDLGEEFFAPSMPS